MQRCVWPVCWLREVIHCSTTNSAMRKTPGRGREISVPDPLALARTDVPRHCPGSSSQPRAGSFCQLRGSKISAGKLELRRSASLIGPPITKEDRVLTRPREEPDRQSARQQLLVYTRARTRPYSVHRCFWYPHSSSQKFVGATRTLAADEKRDPLVKERARLEIGADGSPEMDGANTGRLRRWTFAGASCDASY